MGYPHIEKPHRFVCVCLFSPLEHASSMVKYLKIEGGVRAILNKLQITNFPELLISSLSLSQILVKNQPQVIQH